MTSKDGKELTTARITDAFGQMGILHHIDNLQGFVENRIVVRHESERRFMVFAVGVDVLPSDERVTRAWQPYSAV